MNDDEHYVTRILAALGATPGRDVLWWHGRPISAGRLRDLVLSATSVMRENGVGPGRAVAALTASNSPDLLVIRYAANLLGAAMVHLRSTNAASSRDMLPIEPQVEIVLDTGTVVLAVDAPSLDRARQICARLSSAPVVAAIGDLGPDVADLSAAVPAEPAGLAAAAGRADDLAIITYTSGTTGQPKGICRSFRSWGHAVSTTEYASDRPRMLVTTPLSHTVGPMADAVLASEGTIVLHEGFSPGEVLRCVSAHRITRMFVAGPQLYELLEHPALGATDTSSLRQILYGGTPASPARLAQAVEAFGPVLVQTYGTTETWEIGTLRQQDHLDPALLSTSGRISPGAEVVVLEPDGDHEVPVGAIGEVCVRSPGMLSGYWQDPDLTARALRGGWFHTGDLGFFDIRGYIHLVGRLADVIKYSGIKIYPVEVENVLLEQEGVAQAAVYGVLDADNVEHVHATVVRRPGAEVTVAELRDRVAKVLSPLHAPAVVTFSPALPLISSGKPDKRRLRAEAQSSVA
jgi:fatty-acyl-CoA synthase